MLNAPLAKRRRKELSLTLKQVGQLCGVGEDVIQRWETGQREPKDLASLRLYARALDVPLEELAADPEEVATSP